jgi:hypothetical protein
MLLSNTFFIMLPASVFYIITIKDFQGLFTALMGVFNFAFAFAFIKSKKIGPNDFPSHWLVLYQLSSAHSVKGNHITLFWSAAVLLLWLRKVRDHINQGVCSGSYFNAGKPVWTD